MIEPIDLVLYAARNGLVISYKIAKQAMAMISRESLERTETARYSGIMWDGNGAPPLGDSRDRWLHGDDANSRAAIESTQNGGVVYWLMRDDKLVYWQPHRGDVAGKVYMVDDPSHPDHWEKAVAAHIAKEVEPAVDQLILKEALSKALEIHEATDTPYGASTSAVPADLPPAGRSPRGPYRR
jgi:hypothetical protein